MGPTLWDSMNCSPPGSTVHGISQARIMEWLATSFPRRSSQHRKWICISHIGRRILYHWTTSEASLMMPHAKSLLSIHTWDRNFSSILARVHHYLERCVQAKLLLSCPTLCNPMGCGPPGSSVLGFSKQEYWSDPYLPPGYLPVPGIDSWLLTSPALEGGFFIIVRPGKYICKGIKSLPVNRKQKQVKC